MRCRFYLYPVTYFLFGLLISGCRSSLPGEGTAIEAQSREASCIAVSGWAHRFVEEFPDKTLTTGEPRELAHLFRHSWFWPVFGTSYDDYNAEKLTAIYKKIIVPCEDRVYFTQNRQFFNRIFRDFDHQVSKLGDSYTHSEMWTRSAMTHIQRLPLTRDGLKELEEDILDMARGRVSNLLPREQAAFNGEVARKKQAMLKAIAAEDDFRRAPPAAIISPPETLFPPATAVPQTPEQLLQLRLSQLDQIPLTVEGRQQSYHWIVAFDQEFPISTRSQEAQQVRYKAHMKRDQIFLATKNDFQRVLSELPSGPDMKAQHAALLARTFPLPSDRNMRAYGDYSALINARQRPVTERAYDGTKSIFQRAREWISEKARDIVHGSGEGSGQKEAR